MIPVWLLPLVGKLLPWLLLAAACWGVLHYHGELQTSQLELKLAKAAADTAEKDRKRSADLADKLADTIKQTETKVITITERIYATAPSTVCDKQPATVIANDGVWDTINGASSGEANTGSSPASSLPAARPAAKRNYRERPSPSGRTPSRRASVCRMPRQAQCTCHIRRGTMRLPAG